MRPFPLCRKPPSYTGAVLCLQVGELLFGTSTQLPHQNKVLSCGLVVRPAHRALLNHESRGEEDWGLGIPPGLKSQELLRDPVGPSFYLWAP